MSLSIKKAILSKSIKLGSKNGWEYAFDNRALFNDFNTEHLVEIADNLWQQLAHLEPQVLVGKGVGAAPLLTALKLRAHQDGKNLGVLFLRDERKMRGSFKKLVEGPLPSQVDGFRAVFVDDLYNKGDTFRATKLAMHSEGFNLDFVGVGVVVDFWHGSRKLDAIGFPFFTIFRRHDIGLTRVDKDLPKLLDNIKWRMHQHHTGRDYMPVKSLPVINNGKLYVGNDNTNEYCYDVETGNTLWVYESNLPSLKGNVSVAQFNKNHIYWSAYDGVVRCANAITGAHIWATKADLNLHSSPCLDPKNNRLYIGTEWDKQDPYGRGDIIALNMSNGHEIWRTPTRGMIPATPIYSQKHNMVVCGSNDYYVYFVNSNTGNIIKKIPTVGEVKGRPIITKDESIVIFNTLRGWVYGVDMLTHEVLWKRNIGEESYHQYPVTYDDKVVFTNSLGHIFCLNVQTGDVEWMTKLRGAIYWGVTLTDKCLIAVTINGYVVLVDKQNGDKLASDNIMRTAQVKGANCAQPAAYDGKNLVIVTNEKGILCYELDIDKVLA